MSYRGFTLIAFFLINSSCAFSQGLINSFFKLSCAEKLWVVTHPFIANKCRKITNQSIAQTRSLKSDSGLDGDSIGGQLDAFRHGMWMAMLSQKICWKKAISLGRAHEKGNYKRWKKGKRDEENALPDSSSEAMDIFNNKAGASIGCKNKDVATDSLKLLVINSIQNGELQMLYKDKEGRPLNCGGEIIENRLEWNTTQCLIPSNRKGIE